MVTRRGEGDDAATGDYFYHTHDHLGSTRNVYAQNKDDAAAFEYTPYGRELFATNRALTTRGYTGHAREAALGGGYYAPFRYYLPNLARWEKRDPLGMVDGPNVYAYVRGDVVNRLDEDGLRQSPSRNKLHGCHTKVKTAECSYSTCLVEKPYSDFKGYWACIKDCWTAGPKESMGVTGASGIFAGLKLAGCISGPGAAGLALAWPGVQAACMATCRSALDQRQLLIRKVKCCRHSVMGLYHRNRCTVE